MSEPATKQRARRQKARQTAQNRRTADLAASVTLDAVDWISTRLRVPYGPHRGELFNLSDWQREFVAAMVNPAYKEVALCCARKNGKTGLTAALVLAGLCGPLNTPHWRAIVGSVTLQHAAELRLAIVETAKASDLELDVFKSPAPGHILGYRDARADFVSAANASGHAVAADIAILDEAGLLEERKRELWNNMHAALSGRDGKFVCLSVLGYGPMFRELVESNADDTYIQLHQADADADIEDETQWHKSNPGLADGIKSLEYMRHECRRAVASPNNINDYKAYHLNLPANPARQPICAPSDWQSCLVEELPDLSRTPVIIGLDLGGANSMTAACIYDPSTYRTETYAVFPGHDLYERGRADSVGDTYLQMQRRGELTTQPNRKAVDIQEFLADLKARVATRRVACLVVDRYRFAELEDAAARVGITVPIVPRGMGFKDGSEDVQNFLTYLYANKIKHQESLLVSHAIAGSHIIQDPMLNMKVDKLRSTSKIDALMSMILAVSQAVRMEQAKPKRRRARVLIAR